MIDTEVDLRSTMLGVRDQGARPTCLAHAISAAHEHARGAARLSPEYLHYFSTYPTTSSGASMIKVARALIDKGQPEESECPYLDADPVAGWNPPPAVLVFRHASEARIPNLEEIAGLVLRSRVPVLGMSLPDSFFNPYDPWVISSRGAIRALHAVTAVGVGNYRGSRVIEIRNSWGAGWGDQGYAWLNEEFIAKHVRELLLLTHEVTS